jgi:hypothetical protein
VSEERPSQDQARRERERALREAGPGEERARLRLLQAASERRAGQLDLAALGLEEALREGAPLEDAGAELAAILSQDTDEPGAHRALGCFSAITGAGALFPHVAPGAAAVVRRAELFRAVFRLVAASTTVALAAAVRAVSQGASGTFEAEQWVKALGREVEHEEARALDLLYGRLLGASRRRVTARLDTPGPMTELSSERIALDAGAPVGSPVFEVGFAGDDQLYLLRRHGGRLLLRRSRLVASYHWVVEETPVLDGASIAEPRLVGSAGGAFIAGVDEEGFLHVSFSAGREELFHKTKAVGRGVGIAAVSECAAGLAVFLDAGARALTVGRDGRVSRARRIGAGFEVVSAASQDGSDVFVLARATRGCELLRLDEDLRPRGEPASVPYLRSPRDARVAWITPDLVLVLVPPDTAHAFGADDRRFAWTARLAEPLDEIEPALAEALELVSYGRIESEWGQPEADLGLARWTREGLGRHGPTVRVETEPGEPVQGFKLAARGHLLALVYPERAELVQRLLMLVPVAATYPAPAEWSFEGGAVPAPDEVP